MANPLANYTSSVPAARSIAEIEEVLMAHGAVSINKAAKNGKVHAVAFSIQANGQLVNVLLPAKVENVYEVLVKDRKAQNRRSVLRATTEASLLAQAERTAWRIQLEWVRIQLSLVRMHQVEFLEIFLPYVCDETGQTFFAKLKDRHFAGLLTAPK